MADIELVIKMPEEYYKSIKDDAKKFLSKGMKVPSLYEIVIKGTPLPKDHGDLIDAKDAIETLQIMFCRNGNLKNVCEQCILDCPVIVEACTYSEGKE